MHIDLIRPSNIRSCGGNSYILVFVNNYSRFTWTLFLKHKSDTFGSFKRLANVLQNQKGYTIMSLRRDHKGEFKNNDFIEFSQKNGINHNFSTPKTS